MTQPRFTRAEYWILESVVDSRWPLTILDARNIEEISNKPSHGLDHSALVDTLQGMFAAGLIEAGVFPGETPAAPLSRADIEAALAEPGPFEGQPRTYYHMTAEGGAQWEAFAWPDWTRYVRDEREQEPGKTLLTCADRQWLQKYLGWLSAVDLRVDAGLAEYHEVCPWQATYWKCLPKAYSVSFSYREPVIAQSTHDQWISNWLSQVGFFKLRDSWYRWR